MEDNSGVNRGVNEGDKQQLEQEDKDCIAEALQVAGVSHLLQRFIEEKVTVDIIPMLDEQQLVILGVTQMGQRVILKNYCKQSISKTEINSELRSTFASSSRATSDNSSPSGFQSTIAKASRLLEELKSNPAARIDRYSKRKRKRSENTLQYQRNLVCLEYMGYERTVKNHDMIFKGIVCLSTNMSEIEVRNEIVAVIKTKESSIHSFESLSPEDFEFVKCVNRHILIPDGKLAFDGNGIKVLYKSGSIYVRLLEHSSKFYCIFPLAPSEAANCNNNNNNSISNAALPSHPSIVTVSPSVNSGSSLSISPALVSNTSISVSPTVNAATSVALSVVSSAPSLTSSSVVSPAIPLTSSLTSSPLHIVTVAPTINTPTVISISPISSGINEAIDSASNISSANPTDVPLVGAHTSVTSLPDIDGSFWNDQHDYIEVSDSSDMEDSNIQLALQESVSSRVQSKRVFGCVEELLKNQAGMLCFVAPVPEDRQRIIVRRKHIWSDTKRALKQPAFNDTSGLNVTFIGEDAHDAGGPTREFFRLVISEMRLDANLFSSKGTLVHNVLSLQRKEYYMVGHVIALSLLYGGAAPHFFAKSVIAYILNEPLDTKMIDEIDSDEVQTFLHKLLEAESVEAIQTQLNSADFRFDIGITVPASAVAMEDKEELVMAFLHHYLVYSCKGELDQLKEGLTHLGVLQLMHDYPSLVKPLFLPSTTSLSSAFLLNLFQINWSPVGSNLRELEEAVIFGWTNYVHECGDSGRAVGDNIISLKHILAFVTGADKIPPMGFTMMPQIEFTGDRNSEIRLPSSSTCIPTLYLPLSLANPDLFAEKMDHAIIGGQYFGIP